MMDKVEVNFMLGVDDEDVEFIAKKNTKTLSLEEQNERLRKENEILKAKIKELEEKLILQECENLPF